MAVSAIGQAQHHPGRNRSSDKLRAGPAKELLAREGFDPVYGARPLKRTIQRRLQDALALEMLDGRIGNGATVDGGEIKFRVN